MTEEEVMHEIGRMVDRMISETIGGPPKVNKLTALRYAGGRFESVEIDDNGLIIEPPPRCWKCGPVLVCAEHMAQIT